jgi:hypothetical protein
MSPNTLARRTPRDCSQPLQPAGSRRRSGPARGWVVLLALACASASHAGDAENPSASQAVSVRNICRSIIGVSPGEAHFDACVQSLSDSLRASDRDRALLDARNDCASKGMARDSSELAECTLRAADSISARRPLSESDAGAQDADQPSGPARSYFSTSPRDAFRRDQLACARLGLDPTGAPFAHCVASLQAGLFSADNPMN